MRADFAERIGLAEIMEQSAPRPNVDGFGCRQRFRRVFILTGMKNALASERSHARSGLGYADPWSDRRIARFVLAAPPRIVQSIQEPKRLAREAIRGIMPEGVRQAAHKSIPSALFERGFKDAAQGTVRALMTGSQMALRGYIHEGALRDSYESYLQGLPPRHDFWWPLSLEMWLRRFWS
jgi:asparagine synthase (glutamine-hydrolysing)